MPTGRTTHPARTPKTRHRAPPGPVHRGRAAPSPGRRHPPAPPVTGAAPGCADFLWPFRFDRARLLAEFHTRFATESHYRNGLRDRIDQNLDTLVGFIEQDPQLLDIRHMAYLLATSYWESAHIEKIDMPKLDRKGKPVLDKKGQPVMVKVSRWVTMAPTEETGHGAGRRYHEPAKIAQLPSGEVRVTEHDGDQFLVARDSSFKSLTKKAGVGAVDGAAAAPAFQNDSGTPLSYFGRGYVQLTWWSNYAATGAKIGRGLDLLLDPDLAEDPAIAYKIMSHCMSTGDGFANGHKLSDYIFCNVCNYVRARAMVNGNDHAADIANLAERFQPVLMNARTIWLWPFWPLP